MTGEKILNYKIEGIREENEIYRSFAATHTQFAKKVMIKTLKGSFEESERQNFIQEIKKISQIQHPNIITLYDYLPTHNNFYLVFEEVKGKSLLDYVNKVSGPIPEEKAKQVFAQILDAFDYAHHNQIEGIGVSPKNINIDNFGKVKVLDTALSRIFREKNVEEEDFDYISFASPEQVRGERTDKKSDIYALGVLLFFCLTGKNPYAKNSILEVKQLIQHENLPNPREFYPAISDEVIEIIYKATAKNPNDRFKSCNEFKEAIFTNKEEPNDNIIYTDVAEEEDETFVIEETSGRFVNVPLILFGIFGILAIWMIYRYNNPSKPPQKQLIITDQSYIGNKRDSVLKAQAAKAEEDSVRIFVESKRRDTTTFYIHKVQPRENLTKIAERYFVTLDTLKFMNDGITEKTKLKVLSGVKVPIWKIHKMKKEETIYSIANQYRVSAFILRVANAVQSEEEDLFEGKDLVIPLYMKKNN